jgi:S1-C subfamily serine protease
MNGKVLSFVTISAVLLFVAFECSAQTNLARVVKDHKPYTIAVALKFSKKDRNLIVRAFSLLAQAEPNGHATGFLVGDGLVMTSYHVVSGQLSAEKKKLLGFRSDDDLEVKAYVNGCQATQRPTFRGTPSRDEQLFMIAQPGEWKVVLRGSFSGLSTFDGNEYLSAKLEGQDGFSGSPVYNRDGELVGVFCMYDTNRGVALLSPGAKAQQFLAEYDTSAGSQP